jgi:hypothetical protein
MMHDPDTVAFDIKYPWFKWKHWPHRRWVPASWRDKHWKDGYRETCITIWHHDPSGHDTDVCGWHYPPTNERDRAFAQELADWEAKFPNYFACPVIAERKTHLDEDEGRISEWTSYHISPGDCVALLADLFAKCRWQLDPKHRRWGLTPRLMSAAFRLGASEGDNFRASFALWDDDRQNERRTREKMLRTFLLVIRAYRAETRPWWQHPKWHVRHWRVQIRPVQAFKRWAFSRCCHCGRGFRWGEGVIGYSWPGTGPRWFRSEPRIAHQQCDARTNRAAMPAAA